MLRLDAQALSLTNFTAMQRTRRPPALVATLGRCRGTRLSEQSDSHKVEKIQPRSMTNVSDARLASQQHLK